MPSDISRIIEEFERSAREAQRLYGLLGVSNAFQDALAAASKMDIPAATLAAASKMELPPATTQMLRMVEEDNKRLAKLMEVYRPSKDLFARAGVLDPATSMLQGVGSELKRLAAALELPDSGFARLEMPRTQDLSSLAAGNSTASAVGAAFAKLEMSRPIELAVMRAFEATAFAKIELAHLPGDFGRKLQGLASMRNGLDRMMVAQETLFKSLDLTTRSVPPIVVDWPALSVFSHSALLRRLARPDVDREEEIKDAFEQAPADRAELIMETEERLLQVLDSRRGLRAEWIAARDALRGSNPRRARHFCASVRTLLTAALDEVAPVAVVDTWTKENNTREPSREQSRFRYVASTYPSGQFAGYVVADSEAMFKAWKLVNKRVHQKEPSEEGLLELQQRAAVWLLGVLTLRPN